VRCELSIRSYQRQNERVVAQCRNIHTAATENLTALAKHGVTAAKLTAFKKKIDAFDKLKFAPRDSVIILKKAVGFATKRHKRRNSDKSRAGGNE
jgi:hypothetical protein